MTTRPIPPMLKALLEFGPTVGFVIAYLVFRDRMVEVGGTQYSGFVAVTAFFLPVFVASIGGLWFLTRKLARVQIAIAVMVVVFGGLTVWLNDARVFKMKPTVIYGLLALFLAVGLWRGQSWLKLIMEDMIPLKRRGWMILTKRVTVLFAVSALVNEGVWRTQSDRFWVLFETIAMPILIILFFLSQTGLFIEYAKFGPAKKKRRRG